ncbi:MAG: type IX secretion system membrane protein PorP/SprF [Saprospirales bacterium]|nr:type IX secretion system membrane protein PorP/SprF [Saprospirales bacterium]
MKTPLLTLLISILFSALQAQDPHFSQFFANRVYLNPAYAGLDPGWTVTMNYRNQWFGIPDGDISTFNQSFRTYQVTADLQAPCMFGLDNVNGGFALSVFRDEAGAPPL